MRNVFLIRHPARVVASYVAKREMPEPDDLGFRAQEELYDLCLAEGAAPLVVDSVDIRRDPAGTLSALCGALGIGWTDDMLRWPAGGRPEDGVWAAHWYGAVHRSTGFAGAEPELPELAAPYDALAKMGLESYNRVANAAIRPV